MGLHISQMLKKLKKLLTEILCRLVVTCCDTFPNGLVWFHVEATPIWVNFPKHGKNAVICYIWL